MKYRKPLTFEKKPDVEIKTTGAQSISREPVVAGLALLAAALIGVLNNEEKAPLAGNESIPPSEVVMTRRVSGRPENLPAYDPSKGLRAWRTQVGAEVFTTIDGAKFISWEDPKQFGLQSGHDLVRAEVYVTINDGDELGIEPKIRPLPVFIELANPEKTSQKRVCKRDIENIWIKEPDQ